MSPAGRWLAAARPRTLFAAACPVLLGASVAEGAASPLWVLLTLVCAVLLQTGANLANDYWDWKKGADTAARKGPPRMTSLGLIAPRQMLAGTCAVFAAAILIGGVLVWRGGWPILLIGIAAVACAVLYTAGPRPLAYLGLGELFAFVFFGPVATAGACHLAVPGWSTPAAVAGIIPGAYAVVLIEINNLRDRETDAAAGKRTLAVRFGAGFGMAVLWIAAVLPAVAAAALATVRPPSGFAAIVCAAMAAWLAAGAHRAQRAGDWRGMLERTGRAALVATAVFIATWRIL